MIGKFLILCAMVLTAMSDANAAILCEIDLRAPDTCSGWTSISYANSNRLHTCSGGSSVTEFEVWGGCGPNVGIGDWNTPIVQTPSGVQYAANAAGPHCYCQIKSINGSNVASSSRWVFLEDRSLAGDCSRFCATFCSETAVFYSGFRSALFQALQ